MAKNVKKYSKKDASDLTPEQVRLQNIYGEGRKDALFHYDRFDKSFKETHEKFLKIEKKCREFFFGKQWSDADRKKMDDTGRPALTINLTLSTVLSAYNEYSKTQMEPTLKARNRGKFADTKLLSKVISAVLNDNDYFNQEADTFVDSLVSGRGFFNMRIDNDEDPLGEVSIFSDDNLQVVLSSDMKYYDPKTWPEVFHFEYLTYEEVVEKYGEDAADMINFSLTGSTENFESEEQAKYGHRLAKQDDRYKATYSDNIVYDEARIVTREYKQNRKMWVFVDPETSESSSIPCDELEKEDARKIAKNENLQVFKMDLSQVRMAVFAGDVLISDEWSDYEYYTVYPLFAYFMKGSTMGMVENLLSPQEQLNKAESQELHIINSTSNGGWQMEEDSLVNMTPTDLEKNGSKTGLVIVRRRGAEPLQKISPNQVPTGITQFGMKAASHVRQVSGMNDGMVGQTGANVSGRVVNQKQMAGQGQLQLIFDNLNRSQKYLVRGLISLIQNFFTEPRIIHYTAQNGVDEEIPINQVDAAGRVANDTTLGTFSATITSKPKRDVQDDYQMEQMLRMREVGIAIPDYEVVANSQLDNRDEMVAQMRRAAGLDKTPEEIEQDQMIHQIQMADLQLELQEKQSKIEVNNAKAAESYAKIRDLQDANQRFLVSEGNAMQKEYMGNALRRDLAHVSSDTALVTSQASNNNSKDIAAMQLQGQREAQAIGIIEDRRKEQNNGNESNTTDGNNEE